MKRKLLDIILENNIVNDIVNDIDLKEIVSIVAQKGKKDEAK